MTDKQEVALVLGKIRWNQRSAWKRTSEVNRIIERESALHVITGCANKRREKEIQM